MATGPPRGSCVVDSTGRRSKVLRRSGLLVGVVCLPYAGVLGAAFMGWGTSLTPSSLFPFGNAQGGQAPGDIRPQGGIGRRAALPSGTPSGPPLVTATPSASVSASSVTVTPSVSAPVAVSSIIATPSVSVCATVAAG
ncbi:hypothetical protein [Streptomyces sp. NPDC007905]|uniref:hypothetical protein n=1 Tax=Streptomyces sp. NPDC007905 TaxID=3364788 RepID=UPI0036E39DA7